MQISAAAAAKGANSHIVDEKRTLNKTGLWGREGRPFRPLKVFKSLIICSRALSFSILLFSDLPTSHPAVVNRSREEAWVEKWALRISAAAASGYRFFLFSTLSD